MRDSGRSYHRRRLDKAPSYLKAAFLMPGNLFALGATALASALIGDPTPFLVMLGAEGVYLGLLSSAPRFRRAVRANEGTRDPDATPALLDDLAPSQREHYLSLCGLREKILVNYRKLPGGRVVVASSEQRIDALLEAFLRLLSTLNGYRQYLNAADRRPIEVELAQLKSEVVSEANDRLKEVKAKRIEILEKRVQRFLQAEESREVVSHQLAGIEDLLRLTHEQSIAIRDPESVGRQLDALKAEVQSTEETVREMEKFMDFTEEVAPRVSPGTRVR